MDKVLKIVADYPFRKAPEGITNYEDIPADERDNNSWWYLDGELESIVGYDKGTVTNCKSGEFGTETINYNEIWGDKVVEVDSDKETIYRMCFDGIVDVEIEGIDKPCIGYFWTGKYRTVYWNEKPYRIWDQRGLVCLKTDFESCESAFNKYSEKRSWL